MKYRIMKNLICTLMLTTALGGCAALQGTADLADIDLNKPEVTRNAMQREFDALPGPASRRPITVAVYSFTDKTGQRRNTTNVASLSSAVTQGSEAFLIRALQEVGSGKWFKVVERVGIDSLTRERTLIKQTRDTYDGREAKPLPPMLFAGMILEGGIIGYDSSTKSGGAGARWLGIGGQTQYSQDIVTVSMRTISVATGEVLASVTVQKTILSTADSASALKFFDAGTRAFEAEVGMTINEPGTFAIKSAIDAGVVELIKEGRRKGLWDYDRPYNEPKPVLFQSTDDSREKEPPTLFGSLFGSTRQATENRSSINGESPAKTLLD
jgi:curli production assembly/transport component CsgG